MTPTPDPTWRDTLDFLRSLTRVPAAQANTTTLAQAQPRWQHELRIHTAIHDLVFTRPGDHPPSHQPSPSNGAAGSSIIMRWHHDRLVEEFNSDPTTVDADLDAVLQRLTHPS